jgi:hypothetical protein
LKVAKNTIAIVMILSHQDQKQALITPLLCLFTRHQNCSLGKDEKAQREGYPKIILQATTLKLFQSAWLVGMLQWFFSNGETGSCKRDGGSNGNGQDYSPRGNFPNLIGTFPQFETNQPTILPTTIAATCPEYYPLRSTCVAE